jgi:ribokinase
MKLDVIGFGALNLDRLYQVNHIAGSDEESYIYNVLESCGGSAANTIIGLSRLGKKTGFIGQISSDPEGQILLKNLKKEQVNAEGVSKSSEGRTGVVHGFVDRKGERALYVDAGVNDQINIKDIDLEYVKNCKILHLTSFVGKSFSAQESLLEELPDNIIVSMDPGMIYVRKGIEKLKKLLTRTNILLLNQKELNILIPDGSMNHKIKTILKYDIQILVVKSGKDGCYVTDGISEFSLEAFQIPCMDTTGAGDAFNAGFLYGFLENKSLSQAGAMGNYVASCCVQRNGSCEGLPLEEKIIEAIDKKII